MWDDIKQAQLCLYMYLPILCLYQYLYWCHIHVGATYYKVYGTNDVDKMTCETQKKLYYMGGGYSTLCYIPQNYCLINSTSKQVAALKLGNLIQNSGSLQNTCKQVLSGT